MNPSPDQRPSHSHFLRVGGLIRHARIYPGPDASGLPLVIVPGLGCASWMYRRLARRLAAERTVWVYDHPGMGFSLDRWRDPARIEQLTDHLAAWLEARGVQQVPLLGHSLGGEVIIDLAARYPHLTGPLVLCAPTGIPENPSVSAQVARFLINLPRERPGLFPWAAAAYLRTGPLRMFRLARDQDRHETGPRSSPRCSAPALVVDGTRDPVIRSWTTDVLCGRLPEARVCRVVGGTHALMDSRPQAVADETLRFLKDVEAGRFRAEPPGSGA